MDRFKVIHGHNFLLLGLKAPAANGERKAAQGPRSRAAEEVNSTQDQLLEEQFTETVGDQQNMIIRSLLKAA